MSYALLPLALLCKLNNSELEAYLQMLATICDYPTLKISSKQAIMLRLAQAHNLYYQRAIYDVILNQLYRASVAKELEHYNKSIGKLTLIKEFHPKR